MKFTLISKEYGTQVIDTEVVTAFNVALDSVIFKIVEHLFDKWYNDNTEAGAPFAREIRTCYYGDWDTPAEYSRTDAIKDGIELLIDSALESGKNIITTKDVLSYDIIPAFEV